MYDPISRSFDHGNKRVTDLDENKKVKLPDPCDHFTESSLELLKDNIMKVFSKYKKKACNKKGEQYSNLKPNEQRGLRKLQKRIKNHEILKLKTDKSGKLTVINREEYNKMGLENCKTDREVTREEHKTVEKRINEQ